MNTKLNIKNLARIFGLTLILLLINIAPALASAPSNDNFADATVITDLPFSDSQNTSEATIEPDDPWTCFWGQNRSIWYTYTPVNNTHLNVLAEAENGYNVNLLIFQVENGALTQVSCQYGAQVNTILDMTGGKTYYFELAARYVGGPYPDPTPDDLDGGPVSIKLTQFFPPANDDFTDAVVISETPFLDTVDLTNATSEPGEPAGYLWWISNPKSVWYTYTPATSGSYTAESNGVYGIVVAGYKGVDLHELQNLACNASSEFSARISLWLEAGTTYYFQTFATYNGADLITNFSLYATSPIEPNFGYSPADPTINEIVQFSNNSFDPAGVGFQTCVWDFGDGGSSTDCYPVHSFVAEGDYTVQLSVTTYDLRTGSTSQTVPVRNLSPANDNFSNATVIQGTPYSDYVNTTRATTEAAEPWACGSGFQKTIWYSFTPPTSGLYTAETNGGWPVLAVYNGQNLSDLQIVTCVPGDWVTTIRATLWLDAGTTYYYQTYPLMDWWEWSIGFNLYPTPLPDAYISYWPGDPFKSESIQFNNDSYDPVGVGFETCAWDFGDGSSASECYPTHTFVADGDYTVQLTATTYDGRTASTTQVVQVRTHDIGITRFIVPNSARIGQTKQINVYIKNLYYTETVQVDLYKVTANGDVWVGSLVQSMPVRPANRAQLFTFAYTFTSEDAAAGKVIFKVIATVQTARDAFPFDNEMISFATKVTQ